MQVSQSNNQPRIAAMPPGDVYYDDEAAKASAVAADEVNEAYGKYQKAQERRKNVLLNHNPQDPAAKTAVREEEYALWIFQNAVVKSKNNGHQLPEPMLAFYEQSLEEESASFTASGNSDGVGTTSAPKKGFLDFVDRVSDGVAKSPREQEKAAAKLSQLNKLFANLETLRLLMSSPVGGDKGGLKVKFDKLLEEINSIMNKFGDARGVIFPSGSLADAQSYVARFYPGADSTVKIVKNNDGTYRVEHNGGKIYTSDPSNPDGKAAAEKWAVDKFGQDAAVTVKANGDGTYSVYLDLGPLDKVRSIYLDLQAKQGNGHLGPDQVSLFETANEAQKKSFESQLSKSVQLTAQGQENMFAAIQALSAMIESFQKMLMNLAPK